MDKININNRRYLGSKYKLIDFIKEIVDSNCKGFESFFDVFAGTGVVGYKFNKKNVSVIINDILKSNYYLYNTWFGSDEYESIKVEECIAEYNNCKTNKENYFSLNFSNTYFSKKNCMKIGYIREDIEKKYLNNFINLREKYILVTALLYSIDRIANTVGHYDAYRKNSELKENFKLKMLNILDNKINENNKIYNINSNELVKMVSAEVAYVDPPYNSRQYSDAYHLLENIALWQKPEVYGIAKKMNRRNIKSDYCTNKAQRAFSDLIDNINSKYILVSYNNMGNKGDGRSHAKISDKEIVETLEKKGKLEMFEKEFGYFSTGKTNIRNHMERVFLCKVGEKKSSFHLVNNQLEGNYVKSPLNYVGGKYKLLEQIIPQFPSGIRYFVDMFCGGFNVGINVKAEKHFCIDKQVELIRILKLLKKTPYIKVLKKIEEITNKYNLSDSFINGYNFYNCDSSKGLGSYNKEKFLKLRNDYNNMLKNSINKDYYLLTLIIFCFNHQFRFNLKGNFNMPVGKRDFNNSIRKNLLNFLAKLEKLNIEFLETDFRNFELEKLNSKDFLYFDPPYFLGTASYNENSGWNEKDERDLLDFINKVNQKNIKFALSNVLEHKGVQHMILLEWAVKNKYNIKYLKYNYNNSNYQLKDKNSKTSEVLITNF